MNLMPQQNGRYFADDIFKYILENVNFCILNKKSFGHFPCVPDLGNNLTNMRRYYDNYPAVAPFTNMDQL